MFFFVVVVAPNQLECFPVSTWYHGDADPKEEEHEDEDEDEDDFSRQGATSQLSGTYKATSLSFRPNNGPQVNGLDPDLIATCPHCHLALPLITLRWHEVPFLHLTPFICTILKCSYNKSFFLSCVLSGEVQSSPFPEMTKHSSGWIYCIKDL